jgi:hypothetical protein
MASNLQNLQTAWLAFGDERLAKPLEKLTGFLNYMAEHPKIATTAMWGLTAAVGALAAVKIGASLTSFIVNLKGIKSGKIDLAGAAGGGAGIPVHVTNWGGAAGSSLLPGGAQGLPGASAAGGNARQAFAAGRNALASVTKTQLAGGAVMGGLAAAPVAILQMRGELDAIKQDETLTNKERGKATGGAIGDAGGKIIGGAVGGAAGMAAGAAVGAAVGSVVPVLGTAVGALVGAGIGALGMWAGSRAGRAIGEGIGEAVAKEDIPKILEGEINAVPAIPQGGGNPVLEGTAQLENHVYIHRDRYEVESYVRNNNTPIAFPTGAAAVARESAL